MILNIITILCFIVIIRYFVIANIDNSIDIRTKCKLYYLLFILTVFWLSLYCSKRYDVAIMMALIALGSQVVYRYNVDSSKEENTRKNDIYFVLFMGLISFLSFYLRSKNNYNKKTVQYISYFIVLYFSGSFIEWFLHRYIMHCYFNSPWLHEYHTSHDNIMSNLIEKSCTSHHNHHKSVNPDMKLKEIKDKYELFFDWITTFMIWLIFFLVSFFTSNVLDIHVDVKIHLFATITAVLFYVLFWNTFHPTMHKSNLHIGLDEGAPNLNIDIGSKNIYYNNHVSHHNIKGNDKGNYNVVFLGIDEVMGTNTNHN